MIRCPVDSCPQTYGCDNDGSCDMAMHLVEKHHLSLDDSLQWLCLVEVATLPGQ